MTVEAATILIDPWSLAAMLLALAILVLGWLAGLWLRRPLVDYVRQLEAAEASLNTHFIGSDYEAQDEAMEVSPTGVVADAVDQWLDRCTGPDGTLDRSESAGRVLDESLLERAVPTLRWLDVTPNLVIGVGLGFTFLLLALAIWLAAGAATGGDPQAIMQRLLSTAGIKFATSIAAILVSLLLIADRTRLYAQADSALLSLVARLDAEIPHRAPENLSSLFDAVNRQSDAMEQVATRIAAAEDAREAGLTRALATAMAPMAQAIADMGHTVATTNSETMERMVKDFTRELGAATARHNADLAEILKATNEALQTLPGDIAQSGKTLAETLANARDGLESLQKIGGNAMAKTADRLEKLAAAVQAADLHLANRIDIAEGDAKAASVQLDALSKLIASTTPEIGKAADASTRAAGALEAVETASMQAKSRLNTDVAAWVAGMDNIDDRMSTILSSLKTSKPAANPVESPDEPRST